VSGSRHTLISMSNDEPGEEASAQHGDPAPLRAVDIVLAWMVRGTLAGFGIGALAGGVIGAGIQLSDSDSDMLIPSFVLLGIMAAAPIGLLIGIATGVALMWRWSRRPDIFDRPDDVFSIETVVVALSAAMLSVWPRVGVTGGAVGVLTAGILLVLYRFPARLVRERLQSDTAG
jgi:hypothetical protein